MHFFSSTYIRVSWSHFCLLCTPVQFHSLPPTVPDLWLQILIRMYPGVGVCCILVQSLAFNRVHRNSLNHRFFVVPLSLSSSLGTCTRNTWSNISFSQSSVWRTWLIWHGPTWWMWWADNSGKGIDSSASAWGSYIEPRISHSGTAVTAQQPNTDCSGWCGGGRNILIIIFLLWPQEYNNRCGGWIRRH